MRQIMEPLYLVIMSDFQLGRVVMTPGIAAEVPVHERAKAFQRHGNQDWGDISQEDRLANGRSLKGGFRLLSVYHTEAGLKFWVITEADRSVTTILLPDEY
jgi:hypothetical protein